MSSRANFSGFCGLILAVAATAHAQAPDDVRSCLRSGETLTFLVKVGWFEGGHLRIATTSSADATGAHIQIQATSATEGRARKVYTYDNRSTSTVDATSGHLLRTEVNGVDGKKAIDRLTVLDHATSVLVHTDRIRPQKSYQVPLPVSLVDLSLTMLCARFWNLAVGDSRRLAMTYEGELYELEIKALKEEDIRTPLGKFRALVLEPVQLGELKGAFVKGTAFRIYLSRETLPRVVRVDSMAHVFNMVALLESVDEGTPFVTNR